MRIKKGDKVRFLFHNEQMHTAYLLAEVTGQRCGLIKALVVEDINFLDYDNTYCNKVGQLIKFNPGDVVPVFDNDVQWVATNTLFFW